MAGRAHDIDATDEARPFYDRTSPRDVRKDLMEPLPVKDEANEEGDGVSMVMLFAAAKYLARDLQGPRDEGKRPADLERAADDMIAAMGRIWRAGYRCGDVGPALFAAEKRARLTIRQNDM